jgi:hypothetical protein
VQSVKSSVKSASVQSTSGKRISLIRRPGFEAVCATAFDPRPDNVRSVRVIARPIDGDRHKLLVPTVVARPVAADQQHRGAPIECVEHPIRAAPLLDTKLPQIWVCLEASMPDEAFSMSTRFLQKADCKIDTLLFFRSQTVTPVAELVGELQPSLAKVHHVIYDIYVVKRYNTVTSWQSSLMKQSGSSGRLRLSAALNALITRENRDQSSGNSPPPSR